MIDDLSYDDDLFDDDGQESDPLAPFLADGTIMEVLGELKSGKEGTVYCCRANPSTGMDLLAAKVYRAQEHRTFRNDAAYREGTVILNGHDRRAATKKTTWGRKVKAGLWINHEYETLHTLAEAGADVPTPLAISDQVLLMSYVGSQDTAAPKLHEVSVPAAAARPLFDRVLANIELFLRLHCVHGDLSPYNILYWHGQMTIIDFPQTVDARTNPSAVELLARDIGSVYRYFQRYGIRSDPERIARHLWDRYRRAEL